MAKENSTLISKRIDTDILLRFACTTQIQDAIHRVGIKTGDGFIVIAIGKKFMLNKLFNYVKPFLNNNPLSKNNQIFLRKKFNISKNQIDAIISLNPLEDLLTEKATILI